MRLAMFRAARRRLCRMLGVAAVACLTLAPGAFAQQRIAAVVNDDVVSVQDLNDRLDLVMFTSGVKNTPQARQGLAPQVLRSLVEEALQLQEAKRLGITVQDQEIDQALANIAERNTMDVPAMRRLLANAGVDFETLLAQLRAQIAWVKIINQQIRPRVNVTVDQLDLAVQEARLNERQPEYLLSEIVLPVDNPSQEDAVAADARRLVEAVRNGGSFESLARQVSAAASAEQGGDLGWVRSAVIPPDLLAALEQLKPGDVSAPLRSPVGYHVFWLRDRRLAPAQITSGDAQVEVSLSQILFPFDEQEGRAATPRLHQQALALRPQLLDCDAINRIAAERNLPGSGALGWVRIGDLPPDFARVLVDLPIGQASEPLQGPAGVHLIMVCDRRGAVRSVPQREEIAQRLESEQIDRLARRYLRDLRTQAFVDIRM
ncbi:MAG TPA: peptidylprolyl isomerase [Geminicoccaceae bacterium]|nr:peptidylprolyl isomerase [Geminicoccaceae bacterium]